MGITPVASRLFLPVRTSWRKIRPLGCRVSRVLHCKLLCGLPYRVMATRRCSALGPRRVRAVLVSEFLRKVHLSFVLAEVATLLLFSPLTLRCKPDIGTWLRRPMTIAAARRIFISYRLQVIDLSPIKMCGPKRSWTVLLPGLLSFLWGHNTRQVNALAPLGGIWSRARTTTVSSKVHGCVIAYRWMTRSSSSLAEVSRLR